MVGAIVKRDILAHPWVTIRCFGWRVFFRALLADSHTTFLSLLTAAEALKPAGEGVPEFVARCVELELKAGRFYASLSRRFANDEPVRDFFAALACQEEGHAELLELAETAASRARWNEAKAAPWRQAVPQLERRLDEITSSLPSIHTVSAGLQQVIALESSEINDVLNGVIGASDSDFVRRMRAFRNTTARHLQFIRDSISDLAPELVPASQVLCGRCAA
jgi:hypothetical protein